MLLHANNNSFVYNDVNVKTWSISQCSRHKKVSQDFGCGILLCFTFITPVYFITLGPVSIPSILFVLCITTNYVNSNVVNELSQSLICLVFIDFHHLIPWIVCCRYGDGCYVSFGSDYNVPNLHLSDHVVSPIAVFWYMSNYCAMYPWSPIFLLHWYSWSWR